MPIDWKALAVAETHPLRIKLLEFIASSDEPFSPKQLAQAFDAPLATVSFHMGELRNKRLIELHHTEPRRGATAHFYVMAERDGG